MCSRTLSICSSAQGTQRVRVLFEQGFLDRVTVRDPIRVFILGIVRFNLKKVTRKGYCKGAYKGVDSGYCRLEYERLIFISEGLSFQLCYNL